MPKALDLAGQKFGKLTVLERMGKDKHGHYVWRCRCDCGNEVMAVGYAMRSGTWRSCGKCVERIRRAADLAGTIIGDYKAIERIGTQGTSALWKCICTTCGHEKTQTAYSFRLGKRAVCPDCTAGLTPKEIAERRASFKQKPEPPAPPKPKARPTMEQINAAAREKGMTYGRYMAAYGERVERYGELP